MKNLLTTRRQSLVKKPVATPRGSLLAQPTFSRLGAPDTPPTEDQCPFPVGSEVTCIDDSHFPRRAPKDHQLCHYTFPAGFLVKGRTYKVTRALQHRSGTWGIQLEGLPIRCAGIEITWLASRFTQIAR